MERNNKQKNFENLGAVERERERERVAFQLKEKRKLNTVKKIIKTEKH